MICKSTLSAALAALLMTLGQPLLAQDSGDAGAEGGSAAAEEQRGEDDGAAAAAVPSEEAVEEADIDDVTTEDIPQEGVDLDATVPETSSGPVEAGSTDEMEEHAPAEGADHGDEHGDDHGEDGDHGHGAAHIENVRFPFDGPFGRYDQFQLQRGLQIYTEICAACHGLKHVAIRTLQDEGGVGLPEDQVRAYAGQFEVFDPEIDDFRPATPNDKFPESNLETAPDLSLMAKARAGFHGPYGLGINQLLYGIGGPEYIVAILTGYTGETREQAGTTFYENTAFPGGWIAMAPPLQGEDIEFADGHDNSLQHEAEDVAAFLMWAAEPKMMARKQAGLVAVAFLGLFAVLLYLTNKRLWSPHKYGRKPEA